MAYSSPATQTAGAVATAAYANTLKAGLDYLANPPSCRVYNSANISIPNNTQTSLTFNSERWDTDSMHSTSVNTNRLTVVTAGLYVVTGGVNWASNGAGRRLVYILLSGTQVAIDERPLGGGVDANHTISTIVKCAAGQYLELAVYQNSGGAVNVGQVANASPEFSAVWVGLG